MTLTEARKITHLLVNIDRGATSDLDLLDALHVEFPSFEWKQMYREAERGIDLHTGKVRHD